MIFVSSYSIAVYSIMHPVSKPDISLLLNVPRIPYWNLYGELNLEEIEKKECTSNVNLYENGDQPRCPSEEGKIVVPILMGIYMLIANILLINLLIAIFSNTYQNIQEKADLHWRFQKFSLVFNYSYRTVLPPPFNVFSYAIQVCTWIKLTQRRFREGMFRSTALLSKVSRKGRQLTHWEKTVAAEYLHRTSHNTAGVGSSEVKREATLQDTSRNQDDAYNIREERDAETIKGLETHVAYLQAKEGQDAEKIKRLEAQIKYLEERRGNC
ncbi:transient receptor potential cation channel subfamily M member 1-like [Ylistrum balloti]|uniref:transient receptor potential cation channel subfamily M member 1-like n=1 Tax=Ylistrum balloti TaxID=509963 RepID=UPI002905E92E|nr:transient receptor potential cation channel subfamily M member 1-like [Ylistrum balloti]